MTRTFFIVGPTAAGKSELAADVAREMRAEVVSADAFQIYHGLNLLTAKPDAATLAKAPHHLIGTTPLHEEMNAEKFQRAAADAIDQIHSHGRPAVVVGGSGLYIKALTHGLARLPQVDPKLRAKLNALSTDALRSQLSDLDPETMRRIDAKNRRRLIRALEICLTTGKRPSEHRTQWNAMTYNKWRLRLSRPGRALRTNQSQSRSDVRKWRDRRGAERGSDEFDCLADDRFARDPRTPRGQNVDLAMCRRDSTSDAAIC